MCTVRVVQVVLKLQGVSQNGQPHNYFWHASAISVSSYGRTTHNRVINSMHSTRNDEDFALGVDRRSET